MRPTNYKTANGFTVFTIWKENKQVTLAHEDPSTSAGTDKRPWDQANWLLLFPGLIRMFWKMFWSSETKKQECLRCPSPAQENNVPFLSVQIADAAQSLCLWLTAACFNMLWLCTTKSWTPGTATARQSCLHICCQVALFFLGEPSCFRKSGSTSTF